MKRWISLLAAVGTLAVLACPERAIAADDARTSVKERILVIHATPSAPANDPEKPSRSSVYEGIIELLTDKGYRIVDKASAEQCSLQVAATHDIDPHLNKAASFGLKFFSEYTVYYKTATITKERDDDTKGALVRTTAKVIDNTSCQVVTAKSAEASSSGLSLNDAIDKAGRSAGKKLGFALSAAMEKHIRENNGSGRIYTIVLDSGEKDTNLLAFLAQMEQTGAVSAARESESGGGKATFEIIYKGKRDQLDRDIIKAAAKLGWGLSKIRSEGNRSSWKIK